MKITKDTIRQIIKEEVGRLLAEDSDSWQRWVLRSKTPEELESNLVNAHDVWSKHTDRYDKGPHMTPEQDDRAWGRALSGILDELPGGDVKNALHDVIDDLVLTKLGGSGGKKMKPQLYSLTHPRQRR